MMKTIRSSYVHLSICFLIFFSCTYISTNVYKFDGTAQDAAIQSPTKVHLYDGSMIVFADGFTMTETNVEGTGIRYDLSRQKKRPIQTIPKDSVAFIEYYEIKMQTGPFLAGLGAPLLFLAAIQNEDIHKAFFGCCPTVYSLHEGQYMLEAECFSYSISPRIEAYDLDRVDHGQITDGTLYLNVRNEALETHYINQMKIIVVEHSEEYESFPLNRPFLETKDRIILFGRETPLLEATSKTGRHVTHLLAGRDSEWYESDSLLLEEIQYNVEKDWLDIHTAVPPDAEKMVVALRFRNTLFYTVEFYDVLLDGFGAHAVDWMGVNMHDPLYLLQLYKWYQKYYGIQVELWSDNKIKAKEFIDDSGPLAWRQVAFELPVPDENSAKIRLNFLPDNVMIDWVGISYDSPTAFAQHQVECSEIRDVRREGGELSPAMLQNNDDRYFITQPAESYQLTFPVGEEPAGQKRTYFMHSRGYYIEWIRRDWFEQQRDNENTFVFQMDESSIRQAAQQWIAKKGEFETLFFNSKIQVKERP